MVEFKICIQESMDEFEGRESWELRFQEAKGRIKPLLYVKAIIIRMELLSEKTIIISCTYDVLEWDLNHLKVDKI